MEISQLYEHYKNHPQVITDSRRIKKGCLFFALKGERFDGNTFAAEALRQGAAYSIIDDANYNVDTSCILVDNVLETLQKLATYHRQQFEIPIIAITGSNGKTTTKELLYEVLRSHYRTHATAGNLNNHIGVPLTLLAMPENTEVAVVEMGANHIGEIAELCEIARPTHGLITNVGKAHLEGFGSFEGVRKAKGELYTFLQEHKGIVFINEDEEWLGDMAKANFLKVGYLKSDQPKQERATYEVVLLGQQPFIQVGFLGKEAEMVTVQSQLAGIFNFNNIMTAIALGRYFKVPPEKIKKAIESYLPQNNRSQILEKEGTTYILDAYNANPTSMRNALDYLKELDHGYKIAILGDMLELGEYSKDEHQSIIRYAENCDLKELILVGQAFKDAFDGSEGSSHQVYNDTQELKDEFVKKGYHDACILLKGSRGIGLEKLLD